MSTIKENTIEPTVRAMSQRHGVYRIFCRLLHFRLFRTKLRNTSSRRETCCATAGPELVAMPDMSYYSTNGQILNRTLTGLMKSADLMAVLLNIISFIIVMVMISDSFPSITIMFNEFKVFFSHSMAYNLLFFL